ncbi:MAG: DUF6705 family protein [Bacteroidota bacterium]
MKALYILLLFCGLLSISGLRAQTIYPIETYFDHVDEDNVYFKDVNGIFNKFIGTWEYSTATQYFKITFLKKQNVEELPEFSTRHRYFDMLQSNFQYKEKVNGNWVVVYNTYPAMGQILFSRWIEGSVPDNPNTIEIFYNEPYTGSCPRSRREMLKIIYSQSGNVQQLSWQRTVYLKTSIELGEPCADGTPSDTSAYKIPANMTLTKIN